MIIKLYDYSEYDASNCHDGGQYGYWTEYKKINEDLYEISYHTTADFPYCPACGGFYTEEECDCGGECNTICTYDLDNILRKFVSDENHWIEYESEIKVGDTYSDPEGDWIITAIDGVFVDIKEIKSGFESRVTMVEVDGFIKHYY